LAQFDLELIQFDVVNAFVNAQLDEEIYMRLPPGYRKPGVVLQLQRALFGLRKAPLLWQKHFTGTLERLGFQRIPHEPCCYSRDGVLIFFYVDDIVIAFEKGPRKRALVDQITAELKATYTLTGGESLQWFLGIEILRDRQRRLIWLWQGDYIDKIGKLFVKNDPSAPPVTPMRNKELFPYDGKATFTSINQYQKKIGSILYAAVITRPDIAFAVSRLARFNTNPGPEHHSEADRVIRYLDGTKNLALRLGGSDLFEVASDSSFADNILDRKSSQAYVMKLFGGTIGWRANKQDTVTTSTTEGELLALAQAAKEAMFISRLVKELGVTLDDSRINIQCDNKMTIRLVHEDIARLQTKL
jgi:Reverse transcriptase (RNA-dependent DNA polymerase)